MPYHKVIGSCFIGIMALLLCSCSNSTDSGEVFTPDAGRHDDNWANIAFFETGTFHGSEVLHASTRQSATNAVPLNTDLCKNCHGSDLDGGISRVSCFACHNGPDGQIRFPQHRREWLTEPENIVRFHGRYAKAFPTACAGFCHGNDLKGGIGPNCFLCHETDALEDLRETIAAADKPSEPSVPDFVAGFLPPPHHTFDCNFCHLTDGTGALDFAALIPDAKCEQCHTPAGGLKSRFPTAPDVLTHSDVNGSVVNGAPKYTYTNACVDCHNPMFEQTNIKAVRSTIAASVIPSQIDFTAISGFGSFADGPPFNENICETCHTLTNHHRYDGSAPSDNDSQQGYIGHHDSTDCIECHPHNAGFVPQAHVPSPHDAQDCETCHVTPDTFVENAAIPNSACLACHDPSAPGTDAGGSDTKVETHFSDHYIDPTTGLLMSLNCVECHNPMRTQTNFRGNTNLHFIRDQVRGIAVAFEAETGPYSFAYDLPDRPADMSTGNYICNTCHTQTQHHQNDGVAPGGQSHFDAFTCTVCHRHNNGLQPPPH